MSSRNTDLRHCCKHNVPWCYKTFRKVEDFFIGNIEPVNHSTLSFDLINFEHILKNRIYFRSLLGLILLLSLMVPITWIQEHKVGFYNMIFLLTLSFAFILLKYMPSYKTSSRYMWLILTTTLDIVPLISADWCFVLWAVLILMTHVFASRIQFYLTVILSLVNTVHFYGLLLLHGRYKSGLKRIYWSLTFEAICFMVLSLTLLCIVDKMIPRAALKQLRLAKELQNRFFGVLFHEIRNPLNSILTTADLMDESDVHKLPADIKTIRKSSKIMNDILNDVMLVCQAESGDLQIESVPFDLEELIRSELANYHPVADAKKIKINLEYKLSCKFFFGDPVRIMQVLGNFVSNAIKFTPARKSDVSVLVLESKFHEVTVSRRTSVFSSSVRDRYRHRSSLSAIQMGIEFQVIDRGIGICSEDIGNVWNLFCEAQLNKTREYGGTGMGLWVVKRIADKMDGKVTVASIPAKETKFTFSFVLATATRHEAESVPEIHRISTYSMCESNVRIGYSTNFGVRRITHTPVRNRDSWCSRVSLRTEKDLNLRRRSISLSFSAAEGVRKSRPSRRRNSIAGTKVIKPRGVGSGQRNSIRKGRYVTSSGSLDDSALVRNVTSSISKSGLRRNASASVDRLPFEIHKSDSIENVKFPRFLSVAPLASTSPDPLPSSQSMESIGEFKI